MEDGTGPVSYTHLAINRIINAKEVVTRKAPEGPKAMNIMNIDSNHVLDILSRIMHDADNIPPEEPEEPEKPEEPATPVVQPVLCLLYTSCRNILNIRIKMEKRQKKNILILNL